MFCVFVAALPSVVTYYKTIYSASDGGRIEKIRSIGEKVFSKVMLKTGTVSQAIPVPIALATHAIKRKKEA